MGEFDNFNSIENIILEGVQDFIVNDSKIATYLTERFLAPNNKSLFVQISLIDEEPPDIVGKLIVLLFGVESSFDDKVGGMTHTLTMSIGHKDQDEFDNRFTDVGAGAGKIIKGYTRNSNVSLFIASRVALYIMRTLKLGKVSLFQKPLIDNYFPVFAHEMTLTIVPTRNKRESLMEFVLSQGE